MAFTFRPSKKAAIALEKIKSENDLKTSSSVLEYVLGNFQLLEKELSEAERKSDTLSNILERTKEIILNKAECDRNYEDMIRGFDTK